MSLRTISGLNDELVLEILTQCSEPVCTLALVCRRWARLVRSEVILYQVLSLRNFAVSRLVPAPTALPGRDAKFSQSWLATSLCYLSAADMPWRQQFMRLALGFTVWEGLISQDERSFSQLFSVALDLTESRGPEDIRGVFVWHSIQGGVTRVRGHLRSDGVCLLRETKVLHDPSGCLVADSTYRLTVAANTLLGRWSDPNDHISGVVALTMREACVRATPTTLFRNAIAVHTSRDLPGVAVLNTLLSSNDIAPATVCFEELSADDFDPPRLTPGSPLPVDGSARCVRCEWQIGTQQRERAEGMIFANGVLHLTGRFERPVVGRVVGLTLVLCVPSRTCSLLHFVLPECALLGRASVWELAANRELISSEYAGLFPVELTHAS